MQFSARDVGAAMREQRLGAVVPVEIVGFWWGKTENGTGRIHWATWGALAKHRWEGGLGSRDIGDFNEALILKHIWRVLTKPNCLMSQVLRGAMQQITKVSDLFAVDRLSWNTELVMQLFSPSVASQILKLHIGQRGHPDKLIWQTHKKGIFSVKEAYKAIRDKRKSVAGEVVTSTNSNLHRRGAIVDLMCCWCGETEENLEHMLFLCPRAKLVWKLACIWWQKMPSDNMCFRDWWEDLCNLSDSAANKDSISLHIPPMVVVENKEILDIQQRAYV
ncbi:Ribonuclease H-like superfamily protein [Striga hermonthica]|uniref:Ribonuclease H-like superfamily protein n=1 Tax=Striga hermonthica TaxID=68872 RepID=A0A9N7N5R1_STRHE|nr:Ribonuclease H-like superfamily protein [Striga hermonthica]